MPVLNYAYDAVHWHIGEIASRVVAQSGIPTDRFHFGKIILQSLKDAPDFILQIDGATGETETFESALTRSVQCANALRKMGLKTHDTVVVMAPNHIHLTIPIYACLYLGVAFAGVDMDLGVAELEQAFNIVLPKVVFCQNKKANEVNQVLKNMNHEAHIVTYDDSESWVTLSKLLESGNDIPVEDFKASDFDPEKTISMLVATSGSTGLPKFASTSHRNWLSSTQYNWSQNTIFPTPFNMTLLVSPVQWVTATIIFTMGPIIRFTRLQSSLPITVEHFGELVDKYKPSFIIANPNFFLAVMEKAKCDLTCFERIHVGGSAVPINLLESIKKATPKTIVQSGYGLSEVVGLALNNTNSVAGSVGVPWSSLLYRIVDYETQKDINEPNRRGELWLKGPAIFMNYYNNPEITAECMTNDGWFKTGDIFYRDENGNFFFVERLKLLMKYMNHQISPVEIEAVILTHPGVLNVAVTKIPDEFKGDLPVACVVRSEGSEVTAQEIKDLVKDTLTDTKQLRGGVIFLNQLPMTSTMKINRVDLASIALKLKRE